MRKLFALPLLLAGVGAAAKTDANHLRRDLKTTIQPVTINPSQQWDGNDGPWSTFSVGVGTPPQFTRVLISTNAANPWVVLGGLKVCENFQSNSDKTDCVNSRGRLFFSNSSSTWKAKGTFNLGFEGSLGYGGNGNYGFDNVTLGTSNAPKIGSHMVTGIITNDFWVGQWGINPIPLNFTDFNDQVPSMMQALKNTGQIPSLSYGFTAGSNAESLNNLQAEASLTLGGYDISRFSLDDKVTLPFAPDNTRDLVVPVHSVLAENETELLNEPIKALIDSGTPHIWLPIPTCRLFEKTFGLVWNETFQLYLVNETLHQKLVRRNPTISITMRDTMSTKDDGFKYESTVDLPYSAFDLQLTKYYPGLGAPTRYFPLRRAENNTQYTLGRTFLQYAYIIADYERQNFSVHPAEFQSPGTAPQIKTILPMFPPDKSDPDGSGGGTVNGTGSGTGNGDSRIGSPGSSGNNPDDLSSPSTSLSGGPLAGVIVGAIVGSILLVALLFLLYRRRRRTQNQHFRAIHEAGGEEKVELTPLAPPKDVKSFHGGELPTGDTGKELPAHPKRFEMLGSEAGRELKGSEAERELEGSSPTVHEMG